jgi:hypothetical protein
MGGARRTSEAMAFLMSTGDAEVVIGDDHEKIFGELPSRFGLRTPQCDYLWDAFYRDPQLGPPQVRQLREDLAAVRMAYLEERKGVLKRERRVRAKDPAVTEQIIAGFLAEDPIVKKCDELLRMCDHAAEANEAIRCSSD